MLELQHIHKYYNPGTVNEMCLFEDFNLSIKKADTNRETSRKPAPSSRPFSGYSDRKQSQPMSFEEMMSKFKQDSEAKFADLKTTREGRRSNYARRSQK